MMNSRHTTFLSILVLLILSSLLAGDDLTRVYSQGGQARPQGQGVTPQKKKSLSNFGPEDVFPGEQRVPESPRRQQRPAKRAGDAVVKPTPVPEVNPAASPTAAATATPDVSPTPMQALLTDKTSNLAQSKSSTQDASAAPSWLMPFLITLTLIVASAFLYALFKLIEKLRQG